MPSLAFTELTRDTCRLGLAMVALVWLALGIWQARRRSSPGEPGAWQVPLIVLLLGGVVAVVRWPADLAALGWVVGGLAMLLAGWARQPLVTAALAAGAGLGSLNLNAPLSPMQASGTLAAVWVVLPAATLPALLRGRGKPSAWVGPAALIGATVVGSAFAGAYLPGSGSRWPEFERLPCLPAALALSLGLAAGIKARLARSERWGRWSAVAAVILALLFGALAMLITEAGWPRLAAFGVGLLLGLLSRSQDQAGPTDDADGLSRLSEGTLAALAVVVAGAVAFQLASGFGVALAALGASLSLLNLDAAASGEDDAPVAWPAVTVGAAAVLAAWLAFRLGHERLPLPVPRADLYQQTPLLGLLLGLLLPLGMVAVVAAALAPGQAPTRRARPWLTNLLVVTVVLVAMAVPPLVVLIIWGLPAAATSVAAGLLGAVLTVALTPVLRRLPEVERWLAALPLVYAGAAAVAVPLIAGWSGWHLAARTTKTLALAGLVGLAAVAWAAGRRVSSAEIDDASEPN